MLPSAKQEMSSSLKEANEDTHIFQTKCHQKVGSNDHQNLRWKLILKLINPTGFFSDGTRCIARPGMFFVPI